MAAAENTPSTYYPSCLSNDWCKPAGSSSSSETTYLWVDFKDLHLQEEPMSCERQTGSGLTCCWFESPHEICWLKSNCRKTAEWHFKVELVSGEHLMNCPLESVVCLFPRFNHQLVLHLKSLTGWHVEKIHLLSVEHILQDNRLFWASAVFLSHSHHRAKHPGSTILKHSLTWFCFWC